MDQTIEILASSAPFITGLVSLLLLLLFRYDYILRTKAKSIILGILISITLLSILPFAIIFTPTTLLFPISLVLIIVQAKKKPSDPLLNGILFVHICYWLFGLVLLTSNANTWGNSNAFLGLVSVSNSILFITYFLLQLNSHKWIAAFKVFAGIAGVVLIYFYTDGFKMNEYSGDDVEFA